MQRWYAARRKDVSYDTTVQQLKRLDVVGWVPVVEQTTFHSGTKMTTERPVFGPYLFARCDIGAARWRAVNTCPGIAGLLPRDSEFPTPVEFGFIERLQTGPTVAAVKELTAKYAANPVIKILASSFVGLFARELSSSTLAARVKVQPFAGPTQDLLAAE